MDLQRIQKGVRNPRDASQFLLRKYGRAALDYHFDRSGLQILDEDWDTLIIFDCARYDVFAAEVEVPGSLSKKRSVASITKDFVERNFASRTAHDVVYLSGNPAVGTRREHLDIYKFVGVWHENERKKRGQENKKGLTDPGPVIEKAKQLHEEHPNKRHIVHFLPPHVPHRYKDGEQLPSESPFRNYEAARTGRVSQAEMREVYAENLRYVVEEAQRLIDSISGKIVLTADHGELLGEGMPFWMKVCHSRWGNQWNKYDYGHYRNVDVPGLVDVPWVELPVHDRRQISANRPVRDEYESEDIDNKLEALGYKT